MSHSPMLVSFNRLRKYIQVLDLEEVADSIEFQKFLRNKLNGSVAGNQLLQAMLQEGYAVLLIGTNQYRFFRIEEKSNTSAMAIIKKLFK